MYFFFFNSLNKIYEMTIFLMNRYEQKTHFLNTEIILT
jgi:hypothetical protein